MPAKLKSLITLSLTALLCSHANSSIIEVVTETTAEVSIDRSAFFQDDIVSTFEGDQISENIGSGGFGSAAALDSITRSGDIIEWQNGNISYGDGVTSTSRTVVDISYQNDTNQTLTPIFTSQILQGGIGMFTTGCMGEELRECGTGEDNFPTLLNIGFDAEGAVASSRFDFQIFSGDNLLMDLSGEIRLINGEVNQIITDFSDVENFLNNFRQTSEDGNPREITFDWDLTDISLGLETLAPGEIGNLRYVTEVTTSSDAFCLLIEADSDSTDCTLAYGSFGDPVGRGGGSNPRVGFVDVDIFEFNLPKFEDGILDFRLQDQPSDINPVNTPSMFAITVLSFGLLTLRLKRK